MNIFPIRPKLLSCRIIPSIDKCLAKSLGCSEKHNSVGIVTCDQDDSMYVALDHATKFADVDVVYAKSFYAGSAHSSGPISGEIMGVLAATNPDHIKEGLLALRQSLEDEISFYGIGHGHGHGHDHDHDQYKGVTFFPHVVPSIGSYLASISGLSVGTPMAYLIAPPTESLIAVDHALKTADVKLVKYFAPPTETNFGGAYLTGAVHSVEAAARAFAEMIIEISLHPLIADQNPFRLRR
ncbi:MAG: ethanolamine utilization microcompartment protein EutL [Oligoflexia bacterium]|nr:ethanolamine utilization microcompartment protein EutL [Oligoflexia bacterium]